MNRRMKKLLALAFCVVSGMQASAQENRSGLIILQQGEEFNVVSQEDAALPLKEIANAHRSSSYGGPRMYLQTEATFLAREYNSTANSQFSLLSSAEFIPGGTYANFVQGADPRLVGLNWINIPAPAVSAVLNPGNTAIDGMAAAPRLTWGLVGEKGWGIQGRYWQMENSVASLGSLVNINQADPAVWRTGALSFGGVAEQFEAKTIDLELTRDIAMGRFVGAATFGARYAETDSSRNTAVDGALRTGTPGITVSGDALQNSFHTADYDFLSQQGVNFEGTGPTFSLSTLCPITKTLSLFTSGRGSVLFGTSSSVAAVEGQMSSLFDDDYVVSRAVAASNDPLYIAELQCGLEWSVPTRFLNGRVFARGAFEYQFWRHSALQSQANINRNDLGDYLDDQIILLPLNNAGQPRGQIQSGVGTTQGEATVSSLTPDFDLIGFSFATGFLW